MNDHMQSTAHPLAMPPLRRTSMAPRDWPHLSAPRKAPCPAPSPVQIPLAAAAEHASKARLPRAWLRRALLGLLVVTQTWIATGFMASTLPYQGTDVLEIAMLVLFAILFGWVSFGFWTAMVGAALVLGKRDRHALRVPADAPIEPGARTAIVMPICNEDVASVFACLGATFDSLQRTGQLDRFDFFVLSDTHDPALRAQESQAWQQLCQSRQAFGRVFYRWRRHHIKRKSGNVADFCRRWGANYRYLVVLDADSVMSGECLVSLVRMMQAEPQTGIIQTAPIAVGRDSLHARIQQFATRVYGPVYTAGLHFWQLGESSYWGHNAIIRMAPFMQHCALGRLPGRGPLAGEILSHDFVEAALMRRAGWQVRIAYDLPGSYEQMPPNLLDELKRDRRWCQGNLLNLRLLATRSLHRVHRFTFIAGALAYGSALLWAMLLALSTLLLAAHVWGEARYFVQPYQLFPMWPEWRPERAIALLSTTAALLFAPKLLAVLMALARERHGFGGGLRLIASALAEFVASALLAPVRMMFHSQFVLQVLAGRKLRWSSPQRDDAETTWREAWQRHGSHTGIAAAWTLLVYHLDPAYLWWMLPVLGAVLLAVPVSVWTSRASLGRRARAWGLFLIPEEARPPREILEALVVPTDRDDLAGDLRYRIA